MLINLFDHDAILVGRASATTQQTLCLIICQSY